MRERKEEERDKAQDEMKAAHIQLALPEGGPNVQHGSFPPAPDGTLTLPERWRAAKRLEELRRDHEPFTTIEKAEAELHQAIKVGREKIESTSDAIKTLDDEIKQIEVDHRHYFLERAEEGSRGGEAQLDRLLTVFDETTRALGDMWGRWTRTGTSLSTRDLSHIRRELEKVRRECCWPQHTEANYRASQQTRPAPKLSEARARFETA